MSEQNIPLERAFELYGKIIKDDSDYFDDGIVRRMFRLFMCQPNMYARSISGLFLYRNRHPERFVDYDWDSLYHRCLELGVRITTG